MQVRLTGRLRLRARDTNTEADELESMEWLCALCGAKNAPKARVEEDDDRVDECCVCCSRLRFPEWLRIEEETLQVGDRVCEQAERNEARIGVITGIDFFKQQLSVLFVSSKYHYSVESGFEHHSSSTRKSRFKFEHCVLGTTQLQLAKNVGNESDHVQELLAELNHHGLCGDCQRVFRISEGDKIKAMDNGEAIRLRRQEIETMKETKAQHIKLREYMEVLELTGLIKAQTQELDVLLRKVEFLDIVSCPYCGWIA